MDAIQFQYVVFGIILGALVVICFLIISALGSYFGASHALDERNIRKPEDVRNKRS